MRTVGTFTARAGRTLYIPEQVMKMKTALVAFLGVAGLLMLAAILAGQAGMLRGQRPADIGPKDDALKMPKKGALNAVSSQSAEKATAIEPIKFEGDHDAAFLRLRSVLQNMPRSTIVTVRENYLHAEVETALLKYVDDVEFILDLENRRIDMRSASRLGRRDFGVNRARLEQIRQAFVASGASG
jgi:uncharacterized protein (DUF1499 family)